jgi:hypothetical protein
MPVVRELRLAGSQGKMLLLTGLGLALAAYPVWAHSQSGSDKRDAYAAAKKKTREDRLRWIESDEMPAK